MNIDYYKKGYSLICRKTFVGKQIDDLLNVNPFNLKGKLRMKYIEKYKGVLDLDLNKDIKLKENIFKEINKSLTKEISSITGQKQKLSAIQVRYINPKLKKSYMLAHRDLHWYKNKTSGGIPPVTKAIIYNKNINNDEILKICPGSNLMYFNNRFLDLFFNTIYNGWVRAAKENIVVFNSFILHHVPKIKSISASSRVILIFENE